MIFISLTHPKNQLKM